MYSMKSCYISLTLLIPVTSMSSGMDSINIERSLQSLVGTLTNDSLMTEVASDHSWALPGSDCAHTFCLLEAIPENC